MTMLESGTLAFEAESLPLALRAAEAERLSAMLEGDVERLARCLSEELIYIHSSGKTDDKGAYLAPIRSGVLRYRSMAYSVAQMVALTQNSVIAIGTLQAIAEVAGNKVPINTIFSAGWSRADEWRLSFWYSGHPA